MILPHDRTKAEARGFLLSALANPNRLKILMLLQKGEKSVNELATALGLSNSAASKHLSILHARHLVTKRCAGNRVYYRTSSLELDGFLSTLLANAPPDS